MHLGEVGAARRAHYLQDVELVLGKRSDLFLNGDKDVIDGLVVRDDVESLDRELADDADRSRVAGVKGALVEGDDLAGVA